MKYSIVLSLFLFLTVGAQTHKVTFIVDAPLLPEKDTVYISGDIDQLGLWEPKLVMLEHIGGNIWTKSFTFEHAEHIEFKFTLGSWEQEALDSTGNVPKNHTLKIISDTTLNYIVSSWGTANKKMVKGQITGKVEYIKSFKTGGLSARHIIIWLPHDYAKSNKRYPVLYAHDGQNIIDPSTASFGIDWQMDEAADSLIRKKEIEPVIIVGIYNTPERMSEYSDSDTGHAYINFIINDLKPLIDKRYRTLPDRNNTAVVGSSMGGLISFIMLWEYSDFFSKGAALSPAFIYKYLDYVEKVKSSTDSTKKDIKIFIANGGVGIESRLQPGVDSILTILREHGYEDGKDLLWVFDENDAHNEDSWAKRFPGVLKFLFGIKK